jgi:predicted NAD/FAD-dependent oxidoreductase
MVKRIMRGDEGWHIDDGDMVFDRLLLALSPHRLGSLKHESPALAAVCAQLDTWQYQPIYTVYLRYPAATRLTKPMVGLVGMVAQWVFDRGQICGQDGLLAVVVSAEGKHEAWSQAELAHHVAAEVAQAFPALPAPIWHKVIAEKRATFACMPGLDRPSNITADGTLWLAGDYTAGDYPATLEGAARSGVAAARGILNTLP